MLKWRYVAALVVLTSAAMAVLVTVSVRGVG